MTSWSDVRSIVSALPETDEQPSYGGLPGWRVRGKQFCWERALSGRDRRYLGEERARALDLADLVDLPEQELLAIHGVGPPAVRILLEGVQRRT